MASLLDNIARPSAIVLQLSAVLGVIFVLLKVAQFYQERKKIAKAMEAFPGPPKHWLYGHNHLVAADKILEQFVSWAEEYPYAFARWFGPVMPVLVVHHPEYAKTVLGQTDSKPSFPYNFIVPWIGKGLLILNGAKWFQHRKMLTPAFHYDVLKPYVHMVSDSVKVMLDKWEKKSTESVEIFQDVSLMTLDSIMKCAFSCKSNCQTQSNSDSYIQAVFDLSRLTSDRVRNFTYKDVFYDLTGKGREFQEACKVAHIHTDKVIKERKMLLSNEKELDKIQKKRHLDFLDILLCVKDANGVGLSDEDLRAEVDTFMFAGHDTTASGISWLFYCLAMHPEYQQQCKQEIQEILGDRDTVEWEDLGKMTYCTMCIKESLRLFPPVPAVSRHVSKPLTFFDGRSLPAGCLASVNIFSIHRNRDVWKDPEVYDPLRFSPENSAERHSHAFLPFSAGSRNCIGQQFAMNEMKVALALTLLRFELRPDAARPPTLIPQMILRSSCGIHLRLKKIC
ncbi:cytochrome P450 4A25 [Dryobates pubescens]|uniref:cytochrome P450 4A25 n=1 Tax=Dryobates pubescens TaxID=118200 RepID=UPI0023B8A26F|nr:cytochrome P450 4A25 [Dryobates pubescens]